MESWIAIVKMHKDLWENLCNIFCANCLLTFAEPRGIIKSGFLWWKSARPKMYNYSMNIHAKKVRFYSHFLINMYSIRSPQWGSGDRQIIKRPFCSTVTLPRQSVAVFATLFHSSINSCVGCHQGKRCLILKKPVLKNLMP